ncbi:hypothetical protein OfM1_18990 [Lactovum odontotermitis]
MNLFAIILLGLSTFFLFVIIGYLGSIQRELEKQTREFDNNKALVEVIEKMSRK